MGNLSSLLPRVIHDLELLTRELQKLDGVIGFGQGRSHDAGPVNEFTSVKPNRYKGKRPVDAAEEYLRDNPGLHVPLSQIVEVLIVGGADPGKSRLGQDTPAGLISHRLRISVPNLRKIFDWEPKVPDKNGNPKMPLSKKVPNDKVFVWLAPTADQPRRRKRTPTPNRKKSYHKPKRLNRHMEVQDDGHYEPPASSEHPVTT